MCAPAEDRSDGRVAGAESLGRGDHVGHERDGLGGKPVARTTDARDDLVEADQEAVAFASFGQPFPEAGRRGVRRQGGRADRLAEIRRHGPRPAAVFQRAVQGGERLLAGRIEAGRAGRNVRDGRQVRSERPVQPRTSRQRERRHRRPVVGLGGGYDAPALLVAALDVVAAGEAQGRLVGLGATGDEGGAREALGGQRHELVREPLLGRIREPLVVDEADQLGLSAGRFDDVLATVSERPGHRAAAHRVEVALPA